jgi:hypothetical protein
MRLSVVPREQVSYQQRLAGYECRSLSAKGKESAEASGGFRAPVVVFNHRDRARLRWAHLATGRASLRTSAPLQLLLEGRFGFKGASQAGT